MCESGHYMHRDPATAPGEARTPRRVRVTWRHKGLQIPLGAMITAALAD
jgi:hypothetical protein